VRGCLPVTADDDVGNILVAAGNMRTIKEAVRRRRCRPRLAGDDAEERGRSGEEDGGSGHG
jgi:hypothetical protein